MSLRKASTLLALIVVGTSCSFAQVPTSYFGMHFNHGIQYQDLQMVNYGAFRLWDTSTLWSDDEGNGIATCDPGPNCDPELDWNWSSIDTLLSDMKTIGVNDVLYTFGGVPQYANNCGASATDCPGNVNALPSGDSCGNTTKIGCVLPKDLPVGGGTLGDGNNGFWQRYITALANHVYGVTTTAACGGAGYFSCHAKIVYWDPMNEWDRNSRLYSCVPTCQNTTNQTIYATQAQMQRMTADLSSIVKSYGVGAKVTTPSTTGPNKQGVIEGFLYCTGYSTNCNSTGLLGAHPSSTIDVYIAHDYIRGATGAPEAVITQYDTMRGYLQQTEKNAWANWQWITEGSWGCDENPCQGNNNALTDYDLQAAFVGRLLLEAWSAGWTRFYWYSADNCTASTPPDGTGTLLCPQHTNDNYGPGLWWSGKAYNQVYGWMAGKSALPCTLAGTIYTCELDQNLAKTLAVWDTDATYSCSGAPDPMHHGTCNTHGYTNPPEYNAFETLDPADGVTCLASGAPVQIGAKPILLINSPTCASL